MKIMVASDIHGSVECCRKMIAAFEREEADRILLLGDILGGVPRRKLFGGYERDEVAEMLNGIKSRVLCVRGNCDSEEAQMILEFPAMAEYCVLCVGGKVVFAMHGHVYGRRRLPPMNRGDILVQGHTHVAAWEEFGEGNVYANPGSVALPRGGSKRGYMVMDDEGICWKDLAGVEYHRMRL